MARRAKGGVSGRASAFFLLCRGAASDADWASARATVGLAVGHSRAGCGHLQRAVGSDAVRLYALIRDRMLAS